MSTVNNNVGEVMKKNFNSNGYPYNEDQLNLVEESVGNCDTLYSTNLGGKKNSLIIDPSWIMDICDKVEYAPKEIYVSPRSRHNDSDHNENIIDDFDVKIKQNIPTSWENFKVIVAVPPKKHQQNYLQVCPPAPVTNGTTREIERTNEYEPIKVNSLKLNRSNLIENEKFNDALSKVRVSDFDKNSDRTSKEEITEKSAISYLDKVIDEHETKNITKPVNSNVSNVSFDIKIVATPPKPEFDCFAVIIPVTSLRNTNSAGRS